MDIQYVAGDLLSSGETVIAHGCNAQGVMRSGIAKSIRAAYPQAYNLYKTAYETKGLRLGDVIVAQFPNRTILNIISQEFYGRDPSVVYVSYDAILKAVIRINALGYTRVAFPKIGAGLANGNWDTIAAIIESYSDFTPFVYYIDPQKEAGGSNER